MHPFISPEKYEELRLKRELWRNLYQLSHWPWCKYFADRAQLKLLTARPLLPLIPVPELDVSQIAERNFIDEAYDYDSYALAMDSLTPPDFIKEVQEQQ